MKNSSLNHVYRLVWNAALRVWQVASEITRGRSKTKSRPARKVTTLAQMLAAGALGLSASVALAELPQGGNISAGSGSIESSVRDMTIRQQSDRMVIDWQSYSIGKDNRVIYDQPSSESIALNRVLGGDPSEIRGSLIANGRIFLINPNGIIFGESSVIDVAGIVASTLHISNEDFMSGNFTFEGSSNSPIINRGNIMTQQGGMVVMIAAKIENVGRINVPGGDVLLGAGQRVRLDLGGPVKIEVAGPLVDAYIKNGGIIRADGGNVVMTLEAADQLAGLAINNTGIIQARGIETGDGGTIRLSAGQGKIVNSGTLDVSSEGGAGGTIELVAAEVNITEGAVVDASGKTGGGDISIEAPIEPLVALEKTGGNDSTVARESESVAGSDGAEITIQSESVVVIQARLDVSSSSGAGGSLRIEAGGIQLAGGDLRATGATQGGTIDLASKNQAISQSQFDVSGKQSGGQIALSSGTREERLPQQPQNPAPAPTAIMISSSSLRSDSELGYGGDIRISADHLGLLESNTVSADGALGGGTILLGGGYQGRDDSIANAQRTFISAGSTITANATMQGDGGTVVVWADEATRYFGHISATGGEQGGDGGFAEVSGKAFLDFSGTVDLTAVAGKTGTLLLDPYNITIQEEGPDSSALESSPFTAAEDDSILTIATLVAALASSDVIVFTGDDESDGDQTGTITLANDLSLNTPRNLTLQSSESGGIVLNASISNISSGNLKLIAGNVGVTITQNITLAGGRFEIDSKGSVTSAESLTIRTTAAENTGLGSGNVVIESHSGSISIANIDTFSAKNSGGSAGAGGGVTLTANGQLTVGNINTYGGDAAGGAGGAGGSVNLKSTTSSVTVGTIQTFGGKGNEGVGGGGGGVTVTTDDPTNGRVSLQAITTDGGNVVTTFEGSATSGTQDNAGPAGRIVIDSAALISLAGNVSAKGGVSGTGTAQGGNITIKNDLELVGGGRVMTTGSTGGNFIFEGTIESETVDSARDLEISAGTGTVVFKRAIGLGDDEKLELGLIKVQANGGITVEESITARGGLDFSTGLGMITLGTSSNPIVIHSNRTNAENQVGQGAIKFSGRVTLFNNLTITRGQGTVSFSSGSSNNITGNGFDLTINGSGSTGSSNGDILISSATTAISGLGHISLSKVGDLIIAGHITARSLIYQDEGTGIITIGSSSTSVRTFSDQQTIDGQDYAVFLKTAGEINILRGIQATNSGAAIFVQSTHNELRLSEAFYSRVLTNNGDITLSGVGVSQAVSSSGNQINAGTGQVVMDAGGSVMSLGGRVMSTYDESITGNDGFAVLLRNASSIEIESVTATTGTLQLGTPSAKLPEVTDNDVTGNVAQTNSTSNGISVKTIAANTGGDITITGTQNNFDHTGLIELNGKLNIQSNFGGLSLLGDITATEIRLAAGGGALALHTFNVTTTPVPSSPPEGAGDGSIKLIGLGVTQASGSMINAGSSQIEIDGRDVGTSSTGNIDLAGQIITTNNSSSAVRVYHSTETGSSIRIGSIAAQSGQVTLGTSATTLSGSGSRSGTISQYADSDETSMIIDAGSLLVESRGSITLNNNNQFADLIGVRYGGAVDIRSMDGLRLLGSVTNYFSTLHSVKLETLASGSDAALLNINGQNITANGITLLGQGVGSGDSLVGGIQSSGGILNANNGAVLINAGDGSINLTGTTIRTNNASSTSVQLLNTGPGGHVILGNIQGSTTNASIGTLVLGGAGDDNIQGTVTQSSGTIITAAAITGNTTGAVTLGNDNLIRSSTAAGAFGELKAFTAGGAFVLNNAWTQGLHITGPVAASNDSNNASMTITTGADQLWLKTGASLAGDGITLESKTANGYMTLQGVIDARAGDITLTAVGNNASSISIEQTGGSLITTGVLQGSGANSVQLTQTTNSVAQLGPFNLTAGNFELDNSARESELTIVGHLRTTAGKLDIKSGGAINQTAGAITAVDLRIIAVGAALLGEIGNEIGNILTVSTGGDFTLFDSTLGLTFNGNSGGASFDGNVIATENGNVRITTQGGSLNIAASNITATGTGNIILSGAGIATTNPSLIDGGSGTITLDGGGSAIQLGGDLTTTHNTNDSVVIRDASSVSLSNVTSGTDGSLTLGVEAGGKGVGAVTQVVDTKIITGKVSAYASRSSRAAISLANIGNEFTKLGNITSAALNLYSSDTAGLTWAGDVDAEGTTDIVSLGELNLDTYNLLATGSTLNITGVGVSQSTATRSGASNPSTIQSATANIQAGSGSISLLSTNNDFTGTVQLSATGADAAIRDRNGLVLASIIRRDINIGLDTATGITAIAGTTLQIAQQAIVRTANAKVDLRALGGNFQTSESITTEDGLINIEQASVTDTHGLSVNHALISTSGNISLRGNQVIHSNAGILSTEGLGAIDVTATLAATGGITMVSGTTYTAGSGGIALNAVNNIQLTEVTTTGNVAINSSAGWIRDVNNNTAINITADLVKLTAAIGIGQSATNNQELNLSVSKLVASTGNGGIFVTNDQALILGDTTEGGISTTSGGNISIVALGDITTEDTIATGGANGNISLKALSGDATLSNDIMAHGTGVLSLVTDNGTLSQNAGVLTANTLTVNTLGDSTLNQANQITQLGAVGTGSGGNFALTNARPLTLTGASEVGGSYTLAVTGALALASQNITAVGNVSLTSDGLTQTGGTVDAGASTILIKSEFVDINLAGTLTTTNGTSDAIRILRTASAVLGNINAESGGLVLGASSNPITGILSQNSGTHLNVGRVTGHTEMTVNLTAAGNQIRNLGSFTAAGFGLVTSTALDTSGTLSSSGAVSLRATDSQLTLAGVISASGQTLGLTAKGIHQTAGNILAAATSLTAAGDVIDLNQSSNDFTGAVSITQTGAGSVTLRDTNALELGSVSVGAGPVTLNAVGITQTGAFSQAANGGAVIFHAGAGEITLANAGNNFTGSVALNNSGAHAIALTNSGALELGASSVGTGAVTLTATGITQSGVFTQAASAGLVTLNAGAGVIELDEANQFTGNVSLNNSGNNNVVINNVGALSLAASDVGSGTLLVTAAGISQTGALVQGSNAGLATFNAGAHTITLNNAGNDFTGAVSLNNSGNHAVVITDANNIVLAESVLGSGALTVNSVGVSQSGGIAHSGDAVFNAGAGQISLADLTNAFSGSVALNNSGAHLIAIENTKLLTFAASNLGSGTLTVSADGLAQTGAIVQASGAGLASFDGRAAAVNLNNADNEFEIVSASSTAGGITVFEKDGFAVHTLNAGSDNALTLQSGGAITTASGQGQITAGALVAKTLNDDGAAIALTNTANNAMSINLQARNAANNANATGSITYVDANGFEVAGLATAVNALFTAGGSVTQSGVANVAGFGLQGAGGYVLDNASNQIATLASSATGNVFVVSSTATTVGTVNPTGINTSDADFALKAASIVINESINAGTGNVYLETTDSATGTITQASGKGITAEGLAIKSAGNVTLTDTANAVTQFAADITENKTLSYRDVDGITIANLADIATAGNSVSGLTSLGASSAVSLNVGGLLTQQAQDAVINIAGALTIDTTRFDAGDVAVTNTGATSLGNTLVGGDFTLDSTGVITQVNGTTEDKIFLRVGGEFITPNGAFTEADNSENFIGIGTSTAEAVPNEIRMTGVITLSLNENVLKGSAAGHTDIVINLSDLSESSILVTSVDGAATLTQPAQGDAIVLTQANEIAGPISITTKGTFVGGGAPVATGIKQEGSLSIAKDLQLTVQQTTANTFPDASTGVGFINLGTGSNSFTGNISATAIGMDVILNNSVATQLGSLNARAIKINSGNGAITQTGVINAESLLVSVAGAVTLTGNNQVGTLAAASVARFDLTNAQALTVGSVGDTNGITSTGNVTLTADELTIEQVISADGQTVTLKPYTDAVAINLAGSPVSSGDLNITSEELGRITTTNLVIGSATAGAFTIDALTRVGTNLSLINNNDISIKGALNLGAVNLAIESTGAVTQTAAITASGLGLSGTGHFTLTNTANSVTTLAGGDSTTQLGSLSFINAGELTIGSVNLTGITATGAVDISTRTDDLTVTENISGSSVELQAGASEIASTTTGGNVHLLGTTPPTISATSGNVVLYTGSLSGSTGVAALVGSGNFRYNGIRGTYDSGLAAIGNTGTFAVYREQPILTVTPGTASNQYGDTPDLTSVTANLTGFVNGDAEGQAGINGTAEFTTTATDASNVGDYDITYTSGLLSAIGYGFENNTNIDGFSVTQRSLIIQGSRTYDGTTVVNADRLSLEGLVVGEELGLEGSLELVNKHVGGPVGIQSLSGLTLLNGTNGLASNYQLTLEGGNNITILQAPLSVTTTDVVRLYDGSLNAAGTAIVVSGSNTQLFGDDSLSGGVFTFTNGNAGEGKTVAVSGVTVNDGNTSGVSNYDITFVDNTTSTITPAAITISTSDVSKTYDGTTSAAGTAVVTVGTLYTNASNSNIQDRLSGGSFAFTDANVSRDGSGNVQSNKVVTVDGVTIDDGNSGGNYTITFESNITSTINPISLIIQGGRTYDGTTVVNADRLSLEGLVVGEELGLEGSLELVNKHVGGPVGIQSLSGLTLLNGTN
ncbi:filamentous hemagglutinin N-terminal domain-containing protein, partial [Ectothiorhodosinus mongolicus]